MRNLADRARGRRPTIQWHDNGTVPRVPDLLSDDAPPYRALGLAAVLGVISMAAVAAALQYQRQDGFPQVGPLVETAQASAAAPLPKLAVPKMQSAGEAKPPADVAVQVDAKSVTVTPAPAAAAEKTALAAKTAVAPQPAAPEAGTSGRVIATATQPEQPQAAASKADALTALAKSAAPGDAAAAASGAVAKTEILPPDALEPLALLPEEQPLAAPKPQPAPRDEEEKVAAVAKPTKSETEPSDGAGAKRKIRSSVNLRARPADGSKVLGTIPGGASVQVAANCQHWCAVTYQGKQGFVYKRFIGR